MNKKLSIVFLVFLSLIILALPVLAQETAGPATFAGSITLWIAIIIGFVASFMTLYNAYRLGTTISSQILWFFGAGMFLVVLGFLAVVVAWTTAPVQKFIHDFAFIIGYVLMTVGAFKLFKLRFET